jgi:hypothetical protein
MAALVLFICLFCSILELFDHWDHTAQTGSDTEYAFVVIGLCVGAAYSFARFVFVLRVFRAVSQSISSFSVCRALSAVGSGSFFISPIPISPPVLALRI